MAEYDIKMQGRTVGKAAVDKQGLYYRFDCQCGFTDKEVHSVWVCWEGGNRKLGVCIPNGGQYCLKTQVPVKYIPDDGLTFTVDYTQKNRTDFYPVDAEKPFAFIDRLADAQFDIRDGKPGIVIEE